MDLFKLIGKIAMDGVAEAKKGINAVTSTAEQARGKVGSAFDKIGASISKTFNKNTTDINAYGISLEKLTSKVTNQQRTVELLKQKYADLVLTQGKHSTAAKQCAAEITNLSKELKNNKTMLDEASTAADKFDKSLERTSEVASKLKNALGKGLGTAAKAGAAAVGGAATAVGALMKSSISNYAEYEQLVGGVETLFKDSSGTVMQYADNAYKTAGLSANEYMNTITSFSASLLQSLGDDTAAAAEYGNMAVTDMADNANKMGTNISSIQDAYQGFAKQNYTMLDNLKLGYGGTKSEMERLIADANALNAAQGKLTDYSIENFADIVSAIHDVQTEMGITGTTAKEASTTIQGSVSSMKSAWTNFVTGLSNENADLGQLMDNLIDSVVTAGQNINTRLQILLPRLVEGLTQLANSLVPMLPGIVNSVLPGLLEGAAQLIDGLVSVLPSLISTITPVIAAAAPDIILSLTTALISNLPLILQSGVQIILALVNGIAQSLPQLVPVAVLAIGTLATNLISSIPQIIAVAGQLIFGFSDGLMNGFVTLFPKIGGWVEQYIYQPIRNFGSNMLSVGGELVSWLWNGIVSVATSLFPGLKNILGDATSEAVATAGASMQGAVTEAQNAAQSAAQAAANTVMTSASLIPVDAETPVSAMANVMENDMSMEEAGIEAVDRAGSSMQSAVATAGFDSAGQTAMQRFIQGINSMQGAVMAAVNAIASAAASRMQQALSSIQAMAASAGGSVGGYATGLDYVPYDEFPALLHKGEAVLTASEAAAWRAGKKEGASGNPVESNKKADSYSGITIVQNIQSVPQTPVEFASTTAAYFEQARWAMA